MDKQLGEPVEAIVIKQGDLIWHDGGFQMVTGISQKEDGNLLFYLFGGEEFHIRQDGKVMRAGRFLVGRRIF